MRKFFIGTMLVSLLGALVVGAVLAWTGSTSGSSTASAGSVSIAFDSYTSTGNKVVPNDTNIMVAYTGFTNNGAISVKPDASNPGSATVTGTNSASCGSGEFNAGTVTVGANNGYVAPSATSGGDAFDVWLNMKGAANQACQGETIYYNVTVNVTT